MRTAESMPLPPPVSGFSWSAPSTLIPLGAILVGLVLLAMQARRGKPPAAASAPAPSAVDAARLLQDMQDLQAHLARDLDQRAQTLDGLIAAADERIAALRELEHQAAQRPATPPQAAERAPGFVEPAPAPSVRPLAIDPRYEPVLRLAAAGLTPVQIARQTDVPTGQVELILSLHRAAGR